MTQNELVRRITRWLLALLLAICWMPLAAQSLTVIGNGFNAPQGAVVDASGNVFVADTGNRAIKEILAPGDTTTVPIAVANGHFTSPYAVAIDAGGNLFVADSFDGSVKQIAKSGGYVTVSTIATGLSFPTGIAVDADENVFVADFITNRLYELVAANGYATRVTLPATFSALIGVAVDQNGNLFTADENLGIQEITAGSGYSRVIDLASGNQNIAQPSGIGLDSAGNLYFTDVALGQVAQITIASGYNTVIPLPGTFAEPSSVSIDSKGNVYVADPNNNSGTVDELTRATTTTITSSLNPSALGASVTLTATVTTSAGTPTGTVTFFDGTNAIGTRTLTGNSAILMTPALGLGNHAITARYDGGADYALSVSSSLTQGVDLAATTTTMIASSPSPSSFGQAVTFTATVSGSSPGGSVSFEDGTKTLCANVALTGAAADCTTSILGVGAHAITAMYSGDSGNLPSASGGIVQTVQVASTTTSLSTTCDRTFVEIQPFTADAIVSGFDSTGAVTFSNDSGTVLCANVPLVSGGATCTTSVLSTTGSDPEDHLSLIAIYAGDSNHSPSTSPLLMLTVLNSGEVVYRNGFEMESQLCPIE